MKKPSNRKQKRLDKKRAREIKKIVAHYHILNEEVHHVC